MQFSVIVLLAAVSATVAAPNPVPQESCSLAKVNQCITQCGNTYDCFDDTCYCP